MAVGAITHGAISTGSIVGIGIGARRITISTCGIVAGIQRLAEEGIQVDVKTGLPPDELKSIIGDYDGILIRSGTKLTTGPCSA